MRVTSIIRKVENPIPRRLIGVADAGRYLGVGHKVIRQLVQAGDLPFIQRIAGRSPYLLDINDLDAWIHRNKTRADTF